MPRIKPQEHDAPADLLFLSLPSALLHENISDGVPAGGLLEIFPPKPWPRQRRKFHLYCIQKSLFLKCKREKGKIKIRADEYKCPECGYTETKEQHEPRLKVEVIYTCPHCGNQGEATTEYKRKSFEGVPAFVFQCGKCGNKIGLTKKMKKTKKGEEPSEES